jgi:lipopolysaccharide/colanic/teichoic acid biosynthesis glycosyltransferase
MNSILHAALIEINIGNLSSWQIFTKRIIDIIVSCLVLIIGSPIYLLLAILVKTSSKGPVLFHQERIGIRGNPFNIIKFRSMYLDAEKNDLLFQKIKIVE